MANTGTVAPTTAAPTDGKPAPTEEQLRAAREVVARAKQAGVKLTASGGGQARIMLPNGESRAAYIKRRWAEKAERATIVKEIQSAGPPHDKCTYQIVFAATKGLPGGPDKDKPTGDDGKTYSLQPPKPGASPAASQTNQGASAAAAE
jgi:hypothetical protein